MNDGGRPMVDGGRNLATLLVLLVCVMIFIACEPNSSPIATTLPLTQPTNRPTTEPTNTPTPQPTSTATPVPTPTQTPTRTPTPAPSLKRLTDGQCCTQPFWSPDSKQVLFIDKPNANAVTGIYAVDVDAPAPPKLLTERIAFYTSDMQYAQLMDGAFTLITRVSDGKQFRIRTGGRTVSLSPDRTRVLWSETATVGAFENRTTVIMGANIDGGEARPVVALLRAGIVAWLDNQRLLLTARLNRSTQEISLLVYSLADGSQQELVKSERLRTVLPSPGGEWIAYTIVFDKSSEQNGLWLMHADGSAKQKLDLFGALQWRDSHRFIYIPLDLNKPSHALYEYDATTNATRQLTSTPFRIANGDWALSPDGRRIVFLNAADLNLWVWELVN